MRAYSFVKRHEKSLHSFQNNTWAENQNKRFSLEKVVIVPTQNATFDRRRNEDFL